MTNRIQWIDNARGLCLLFVMAHHTGMAEMWMVKIYLPVFLTLFFFISGYLFVNPNKEVRIVQKILNIFTSLLLPYFIYCAITSLTHLATGGYEAFMDDIKISLCGVKSWFISALVVTELFGIFTLVYRKYRILLCVIFLFLSMAIYLYLPYQEYLWNFRNAMFADVYFAIGMLCRYHNVTQYFLKNKVGAVLTCIYACLVLTDCIYKVNVGNFNETFSNYPFFIMESLFGIPAFIWLCSKINRFNKLVLFIGTNSLLYYYLQSSFIRGVLIIYNKAGFSLPQWVSMVIVLLVVSLIIAIPVILINKYMPVMSGKYRIKLKNKIINN